MSIIFYVLRKFYSKIMTKTYFKLFFLNFEKIGKKRKKHFFCI